MDTLDLLLHPVRLRVVHTFAGGHTRTTAELCDRLPDVPKTSVYRHVGVLAEAGVLEVVDERRVHGAVERRYRLRRDRTTIGQDTAAAMSRDDHRHAFAAATATLLAEFNAYLDTGDADPVADSVGYRQGVLWLNDAELTGMLDALRNALTQKTGDDAADTEGRRPYLVSAIFFPRAEHGPTGHTGQ